MSRRIANQMTPGHVAYDIVLNTLHTAYKEVTEPDKFTNYVGKNDHTMRQAIKRQIALLHNKLLEESGMDGYELVVPASLNKSSTKKW